MVYVLTPDFNPEVKDAQTKEFRRNGAFNQKHQPEASVELELT
jgi:hypothetical protein